MMVYCVHLFLIFSTVFIILCTSFDADFLYDETFLEELDVLAREEQHRSKRDSSDGTVPHLLNYNGSIDVTDQNKWNGTRHFIHNPSPTYIINLYQSLTTGYNLVHPSEIESEAIEDSDTVRSFGAKLTGK